MDGLPHQPWLEHVEYPPLSQKDLCDACGRSVALVMALDVDTTPLRVEFEDSLKDAVICEDKNPRPLQIYEGKPLVEHVLQALSDSEITAIYVLAGGDKAFKSALSEAVDVFEKRQASPPNAKIIVLDVETDKACNFELYDIPKGILDIGRECLAEHPEMNSLLITSSDLVRIKPRHIYELCSTFQQDTQLEAVTSWIVWLRRLPILFSKEFLTGLPNSSLCKAGTNKIDRPIPNLNVKEVVFGEEKLAANPTFSQKIEGFLEENTLSALQAVREVKQNTEAPESKKEVDTRIKADALILDIAKATLERLEEVRQNPDYADLEWADGWGRRNKLDFPLLNDKKHAENLVYLDSAATSQRLFQTIQAQNDYDTHENANIYRGVYELSAQATASYNEARHHIENFIGADRRQVVFTMNTTYAANIVAQSWGGQNIKENDVILVPLSEHHSNMLPWRMLAHSRGARIEYIPITDDGHIDMKAYDELMCLKPKLVCMAHISNVLGMINPIEDMAKKAHVQGARFFLDAAQSIQHVKLDVKTLGVDFVAFSGHKCYGPLGIGCLWIGKEAFAEMDPAMSGGGAISHVGTDSYYLRQGCIQYEIGTPPISQAIGLAAAINVLDELGMEKVHEQGKLLTRYLVAGLHENERITVWGDHETNEGLTGLVSFSVAGTTAAEVAKILGAVGVAVRSGGQCTLPLMAHMGVTGVTRISLGIHTTQEDVEAALVALALCGRLYSGLEGEFLC